jgi:hypothetical protein
MEDTKDARSIPATNLHIPVQYLYSKVNHIFTENPVRNLDSTFYEAPDYGLAFSG